MAAHGGELVISSVPGRGTTMSLRFREATTTTKAPGLDLQSR
jgi:signal transduction histidine kinase